MNESVDNETRCIMVSDVGIPFSSGNEAFALMFPYFRFFESIIDVNRAYGLRTNIYLFYKFVAAGQEDSVYL